MNRSSCQSGFHGCACHGDGSKPLDVSVTACASPQRPRQEGKGEAGTASTPALGHQVSLLQVPSRRRCGGWRVAPRPARGTSRCSSRAAGRCCATARRSATSGAGSCAGSCAVATSPPALRSESPLPWGSSVTSATCTSARTAPGCSAPASAPESCVSGQQLPAELSQPRQVPALRGDIRPPTGQDSKPRPAGVAAGTVASICLALLLFGILLLICGPPAYRWLMKKSRWRAPRSSPACPHVPPAPPVCAHPDARGMPVSSAFPVSPRVSGHARAAPHLPSRVPPQDASATTPVPIVPLLSHVAPAGGLGAQRSVS